MPIYKYFIKAVGDGMMMRTSNNTWLPAWALGVDTVTYCTRPEARLYSLFYHPFQWFSEDIMGIYWPFYLESASLHSTKLPSLF